MTEVKMGLKHVILQRVQTIDTIDHDGIAKSDVSRTHQQHHHNHHHHQHVTDFSINRILNSMDSKDYASKGKVTHSITAVGGQYPSADRILDLSKSGVSTLPYAASYQAFHSDIFAAAAAAAHHHNAKLYSHFFPQMIIQQQQQQQQQHHLNTTTAYHIATSHPYQAHYSPYATLISSNRTGTVSISRSSDDVSDTFSNEIIRPKVCARDCSDCDLYFKQYQCKYPIYKENASKNIWFSDSVSEQIKGKSCADLMINSSLLSSSSLAAMNLHTDLKTHKSNFKDNRPNSTSCVTTTTPAAEELSFKCRICDKVFGCSPTLQSHEKTHKSPRYECLDCGKGFSQLRNYKYHLSVHRGTKEFAAECPECGKTFNDKGYLSSHMKIHRNKKEYECPYCPKSFNQRVAFNMHVRIHTGVKPHKCVECGKRFSRKMLLKQHMRTHSGEKPYQCVVCGKSFADRSNMTLHHRLHSGIKPFNCPICPKAFTKKHHLKTHLNYHTGCKPYVCPHPNCNQAFTQSSNMRTHAKKCQYKPLTLQFPLISSAGEECGSTTVTQTAQNASAIRMLSTTSHHSQHQQQKHQQMLVKSLFPF